MGKVRKKPRVIEDLIDLATYIGEDNLEVSDRFLFAAEETFKQLGELTAWNGKIMSIFSPESIWCSTTVDKGIQKVSYFLPGD